MVCAETYNEDENVIFEGETTFTFYLLLNKYFLLSVMLCCLMYFLIQFFFWKIILVFRVILIKLYISLINKSINKCNNKKVLSTNI